MDSKSRIASYSDDRTQGESLLSSTSSEKSVDKFNFFQFVLDPKHRISIFVLFVCTIEFFFDQSTRYVISALSKPMQKDQGWGDGKGTGAQYYDLVGYPFTFAFTLSGIVVGVIADKVKKRKSWVLAIALAIFSTMTILTGFSQKYWQVLVCRLILGAAQSASTIFGGLFIGSYFPKAARSTAMAVYNMAIYVGFAIAVGLANWVKTAVGWRATWWFFGFSGLIWSAFVTCIPTRAPLAKRLSSIGKPGRRTESTRKSSATEVAFSLFNVWRYLCTTPSFVLLCVASFFRNSGGLVWAYSVTPFFQSRGLTNAQIAAWMSWIPVVGGSFGALIGGVISDRVVKKRAPWARVIVLVLSNLAALPFIFGALFLPSPYSFLCLLLQNMIGEMWIGICMTLVFELTPTSMRGTALGIYFFVVRMGGVMPSFSNVVLKITKGDYRATLVVLWPGAYMVGIVIFTFTLLTLRRDAEKRKREDSVVLQNH